MLVKTIALVCVLGVVATSAVVLQPSSPPVTYPVDYPPGVTPPSPYGDYNPPAGYHWPDPTNCPRYVKDTPSAGWIRDLGPCNHVPGCQEPRGNPVPN